MSSNYDMEPVNSPPWWPGIACLLALASAMILYLFCEY